jgi:hypothetical protein
MFIQDCYKEAHAQFGIDEVYILDGLDESVLRKLQQRAELTLDSNNIIVKNNVSYDMIFIFHKRVANTSLIYRFLEFLRKNPSKEKDFKKLYKLINQEEIFEAIKTKKYVLVTLRDLSSEL